MVDMYHGTCVVAGRLLARLAERRAGVAIYVAMAMPAMIGAVAFGVDAGAWQTQKIRMQRTADIAATAAMMNYMATGSSQSAATAAVNMALVNGVNISAAPTWNNVDTMTASNVTAQVVSGLSSPGDTAIQVTVQQPASALLSSFFSSQTYTVSATSTAEIVASITSSTSSTGATQTENPCVLALGGYAGQSDSTWAQNSAITNYAIYIGGTASYTGSSCTLVSDASAKMAGSSSLTVDAMDVAGSFVDGSNTTAPASYKIRPVSDPWSSTANLSSNLAIANNTSGNQKDITCSGSAGTTSCTPASVATCTSNNSSCTLKPGSYGTLTFKSNAVVVFGAGAYSFNGDIKGSSANSITSEAAGVTIYLSDTSNISLDSTTLNLIAPTASGGTPSGAPTTIAGLAIASKTAAAAKIGGTGSTLINGSVYLPKAALTYNGTSSAGQSSTYTTCTQIVANTVTFTGTSIFNNSGCGTYAPVITRPTVKQVKAVVVK